MKKISYLMSMAVALVMGFSSCSSDDDVVVGEGPETAVEEGLPAVVRISFSQTAGASSRAEATTPEEGLADKEESAVKSAKVFIFKKDNGELEHTVEFSPEQITQQKATNVEITTGSKYFYAVLNLPTEADYSAAKTLDEVKEKTQAFTELIRKDGGKNVFVLTNIDEATPEVVKQDADNKITINVGRAVAKVRLTNNATGEANNASKVGTIENFSYKVLNKVDKSYTLPQLDADKYLRTPYYKKDVQPVYYEPAAEDNKFIAFDKFDYTPENSSLNLNENRATNIMIRGIFTPNKDLLYNVDGTKFGETDVLPTGDFAYWVFKKDGNILPIVFVATTSTKNEGKTVYTPVSREGKELARKLYNEINGTNIKDFDEAGYTAYAYVKGQTYYTTYIKDTKNPDYTRIEDKLSVRRNSLYNVAVKEITKLGKNNSNWDNGTTDKPNVKPQDPDDGVGNNEVETEPDEPNNPGETIDPEKAVDITVDVSVANWKPVEQEVIL